MKQYILIAVIAFGAFAVQHIKYKMDISAIIKEHKSEIKLINDKFQKKLESLQEEYDKLEGVYQKRENDNETFQEKQKELLEDIKELEEYIKNNDNILIIEKLDKDMKDYMWRVYDETNSDNTTK